MGMHGRDAGTAREKSCCGHSLRNFERPITGIMEICSKACWACTCCARPNERYTLRPRSEPDQSWHQIMFASDYSGHCAHAASRRWSETIVLDLYEDLIALVEVRERSLNPWARHWTPLFCRSFCRIAQRENAGCPAALLLPENCSTQPLSMPFYAGCSPRPRLPAALVIYCSNFCRIPR